MYLVANQSRLASGGFTLTSRGGQSTWNECRCRQVVAHWRLTEG